MKKFLFIIFILFYTTLPIFADSNDDWSSIYEFDKALDIPIQNVSDKEFQQAIDFKRHGNKKKKTNPYSNIKANDMSIINDIPETYPTVMITQPFLAHNNKKVPVGFYKVIAIKTKNNKYFINFFQGNSLIAKIEAFETNNDYNQKNLNYATIVEDNGIFKFIYGTIDFSLETNLYYL